MISDRAQPAWLLAVALGILAASCAYLRNPEAPMGAVQYTKPGAGVARGVIVLLPGMGDRPETFAERGFVAALRRQAPQYDVIAVDAHYGYYRERSLVERLEHDVVGPALRAGYRELWLVGASMGGLGAVAYARVHPERITGLLLFAPYMGPREVIDEVKRVGLCAYRPAAETIDGSESFARANFSYLSRTACQARDVALWLAVGADDGLVTANTLLGKVLPADHFLVMQGGHGWKVWTPAVERVAQRAFAAGR
jgi:pimeloyl-ACP methyl ester carboxylesterase